MVRVVREADKKYSSAHTSYERIKGEIDERVVSLKRASMSIEYHQ